MFPQNIAVVNGVLYQAFQDPKIGIPVAVVVGVENRQQSRLDISLQLGEIPVVGIVSNAFANMTDLTYAYINSPYDKFFGFNVGANAFENCSNLTYFKCWAPSICIMSEAFKGCSALTGISTGQAKLQGTNIFEGCKHNLSLRSHFKEISNFAFQKSPHVKAIFFAPNAKLSEYALCGIDSMLFRFDGDAEFRGDATTQISIDTTIKCPQNSNLTELVSYGYRVETY